MAEKELSMVISAFNEEKNVENLFKKLINALNKLGINWEIVFINNHSTDMTGELAEHISRRDKRIHLIQRYNRENKDLGSSLREGFKNCTGKYIIIMDADLSHDPEEIKDIFIHRHDADIIIGSRFTRKLYVLLIITRVTGISLFPPFVNLDPIIISASCLCMKISFISSGSWERSASIIIIYFPVQFLKPSLSELPRSLFSLLYLCIKWILLSRRLICSASSPVMSVL